MITIQKHKLEPHISLHQYVTNKKIDLWRSIQQKTIIYLDLRFWINLRDANKSQKAKYIRLLNTLKKGVSKGIILCPISESIFLELLKQDDVSTRYKTAELIDDLSLGITLENEHCRIQYEISSCFSRLGKFPTSIVPNYQRVWTKAAYVLGETHPAHARFEKEDELAIQKAFFDHMWELPLTKLISTIKTEVDTNADIGNILDNGKFAHANEIKSYQQAFKNEARGMADICDGFALEAIRDSAIIQGVMYEKPSAESERELRNNCKHLLAHLLEKKEVRKDLKTLHILISLHATHRWNRDQRFKNNDLYDFNHAAAALGYCDAFLTEGPLKTMLNQNHHSLKDDFNCISISDTEEATSYIEKLIS